MSEADTRAVLGTDYTVTTNYSFYKPIYNQDVDQWGDHWNQNADAIDALIFGSLPKAGGTMTGALTLAADPTAALGAVTKQYVDGKFPASGYLPLTGGTLTGALTLSSGLLSAPWLLARNPLTSTQWASQGSYIGWNYAGGLGETDFMSSRGGGVGGFDFYNVDSNGSATPTRILRIRPDGTFTYGYDTLASQTGINVNAAAGQFRGFQINTASSARWVMQVNNAAETGSNAGSDFAINRFSDTGVPLGPNFSMSRATGLLTLSAGLTVQGNTLLLSSGAVLSQNITQTWSGPNLPAIFSNVTLSGTATAANPHFIDLNINDSLDASATQSPAGLQVTHNYGGGKGGRIALQAVLVQQNGANTDSTDSFYVGSATYGYARYTQPGSSPTAPKGRVFGGNWNGQIQDGWTATNYYQVAGGEVNVGISAGSSSAIRSGLSICDLGGASQGFWGDNCLWLYGGGKGWRYGIMFGDSQPWPIDSSIGTMFGAKMGTAGNAAGPYAAQWGIDLQQVKFPATGNPNDGGLLRGNGISIDGAGTIQSGAAYISSSASGLAVNVTGSIGTNATIATAGSGYTAGTNTVPITAYGGVWLVTVNASNVPTGITQVVAPVYPTKSPPPNPVTPTLLNPAEQGAGLTINIAWDTSRATLALQPTGGPTSFGGTVALAADPTANLQAATKQYVDATTAAPQNNVGRNVLHNSMFRIAQRGSGPFVGGYTLDQWALAAVNDVVSAQLAQIADAGRTAIGDEEAQYALSNAFTGNAAAGSVSYLVQRVENLRRLAGKTVCLSFWAGATVAGVKLGVNAAQNFGTGGSPSPGVTVLATGNAVTLGTTWARYQMSFAIPSVQGKTLGSNNDHYTALQFYYSSGATNNQIAGNIGVQSGTINLWGVQLEIGAVATPLEKLDISRDLADCQRFYQIGSGASGFYSAASGNANFITYGLVHAMRAAPTVSYTASGGANYSGVANFGSSPGGFAVQATSNAVGQVLWNHAWTASAEL